ncbi:GTP-binding protein [Cohnella nanjingensis]|uniref:TetM/TetW/TetO/TetS family tetracycline resistance ribosomal protection protein n=1 Tax=Cohnella nanjingensis TaxID=1387779 RepID=A0A7X0RPE6_9BACL|nr:TetM/TetW/TetO/TetS family tetracycline resistance ribosomal protection protein [Cohnella nanjingensis]MBB6671237.1 TetM/TetW/TetO/TetS family tetracycline resistance ribosomal protection protein [Cohnella nanjingensis]
MHKTIGLFAHVDAGKTTFAEQWLYHTKSIRQRGRVDHKDAFLDSHDIERERGITVFADQAIFHYNGHTYNLIDTPGHVDFSPEMERAIQVMDYAIVIVSAVEGVQGHTETVWQLLRKHGVPTFFFINKIDRTGADATRVAEEIRGSLTPNLCDLTAGWGERGWRDELIASVAERDERLLELYMDDAYDPALWLTALQRMIREGRLFPYASGSALQDIGVTEFLARFDALTDTAYDAEGPFAGRVYKIRHDESGSRVTYMKALRGSLAVREEIGYGEAGPDRLREKVTQLRLVSGSKATIVDRVDAGQLFAAVGLSAAAAGDGVGGLAEAAVYEVAPTLTSSVQFPAVIHPKDMLRCFKILDAEDPSLSVTWEEELEEIQLRVMGTIQLEVLERVVRERFGYGVHFGPPEILYKETVAGPVLGCGHFEPLGHYAEVHLRIEPGAPNSGLIFANECHPDMLPTQFQNLVKQHLFERAHHGLLTGSPLTDVKVTLVKGRAHNKHTSGGDFREATFRALRQGLEQADNVLLEPWYAFKIKVELDHMGRVLSDIQQASGRFDPPEIAGDRAAVTGRAPVATFLNYAAELAAFTQGRGTVRLSFGGYERCHDSEAVIAKRGYDKNADPAYTSISIFCAKGQGYGVPWDEAAAQMHV